MFIRAVLRQKFFVIERSFVLALEVHGFLPVLRMRETC